MDQENAASQQPLWQLILISAIELGTDIFSINKIITKILEKERNIDEDIIRKQIILMSKNYPASELVEEEIINEHNIYFDYLGMGTFRIIDFNKEEIYTKLSTSDLNDKLNEIQELEDTHTAETVLIQKKEFDMKDNILNPDLGSFYVTVSDFEKDLRNYIVNKIGKGAHKRIRHDFRLMYERWTTKKDKDKKWGILPEKDLINYADFTDYMQIIEQYERMFSSGKEELSDLTTHLKNIANQGRNPLMHCRTITLTKYFSCLSSISYIRQWMSR